MKTNWKPTPEYRFHDGESFVTVNYLCQTDTRITCAITKAGRISVMDFDKMENEFGVYFNYEYGVEIKQIYLEDFEDLED